jgi:hypothetical protein
MNSRGAALWGLTGGLCIELLSLNSLMQADERWSWRQPVPQGLPVFVTSIVVRVGAGTGLAVVAASRGQVSGAFAAFSLGIAVPLAIQKLASSIPLYDDPAIGPHNVPVGPESITVPHLRKPGNDRSDPAVSLVPAPRPDPDSAASTAPAATVTGAGTDDAT